MLGAPRDPRWGSGRKKRKSGRRPKISENRPKKHDFDPPKSENRATFLRVDTPFFDEKGGVQNLAPH